jgi:flagellar hook-associated protein 2
MVDVPGPVSTALGFIPGQGSGENGKEKVGEIDKASGIRLKITGGGLGDRGTVTYVSGFGDQLNDILKNMLDSNSGTIINKQEALDDQKLDIADERAKRDARLEAQEAQLKRQFLFNDAIIQTLNSQGDFIKQQFEAMANAKK